jgi:hypothetical protein
LRNFTGCSMPRSSKDWGSMQPSRNSRSKTSLVGGEMRCRCTAVLECRLQQVAIKTLSLTRLGSFRAVGLPLLLGVLASRQLRRQVPHQAGGPRHFPRQLCQRACTKACLNGGRLAVLMTYHAMPTCILRWQCLCIIIPCWHGLTIFHVGSSC